MTEVRTTEVDTNETSMSAADIAWSDATDTNAADIVRSDATDTNAADIVREHANELAATNESNGGRTQAKTGLVLFDLDGTLTDPRLGITSGVQHALKQFDIDEPDLTKLESFIGPPLRQTFMEQYDMSEDEAKQAVTYYREYFDPVGWRQNKVYQGIPEALEALQQAGYIIGLATSKPTVFAERILNHFDLRDSFAVVVGSNLDGTREDKSEVIGEALDQAALHHVTSNFSVMIGDRKYDIVGGKNWGLKTVGVTYGFGSRDELESAGADMVVETPMALVETISALSGRG